MARGRAFQCSVVLALFGHALILASGLRWQAQPGAVEAAARPTPPALSVRMQVRAAEPGQAPVAAYRMLRSTSRLEAPSRPGAEPAPRLEPLLSPPEAQALPSLERSYVPRELLSQGPVAQGVVLLQWPPQAPLSGSFRGQLRLFIDEQGVVRRVEAADEGLPDLLFEAARLAFQDTRFSPGELQGQVVRSVIRVEVSFENGPMNMTP